jgi:hypothetical protein
MAADDRARGLREGDHARRPLERFEAARDLGLLDGQPVDGERLVRLGAQFVTEAEQPSIEGLVPRSAFRAALEVGVAASGSPQARELRVAEVTPPKTIKK